MESEESPLRPQKSSLPPPPFRLLPHMGSVTATEMSQGVSSPTKETEGGYMPQEDGVVTEEDNRTSSPQKGKEPEQAAIVGKSGPISLLDLPLVILKDIFKEVSARSNGAN